MDIFQSQRFASSLSGLSDTTERLARVMKNDARMRKADFGEISRLNHRLNRVIPIIPASFGIAGATLGAGVASGGFPLFDLPRFRFPPSPPFGPGPGPGPTTPPPVPSPGPTPPPIIKEEDKEISIVEPEREDLDIRSPEYNRRKQEDAKRKAEEERLRRGVPAKVPATPGEKPGEMEEEAQPERTIPTTEPTTPFVPKIPKVEPKPMEFPAEFSSLIDPITLKQLMDRYYDPKNRGLFGRPLTQRVEVPLGTVVVEPTSRNIFSPDYSPKFRFLGNKEFEEARKKLEPTLKGMELLQAIMMVMGSLRGMPQMRVPGRGTVPTVPTPGYKPPRAIPAVPIRPESQIVPTKPGGPLVKPQPVPASQQTINVTPRTKTLQRGGDMMGGTRGARNPIPKTEGAAYRQQRSGDLQQRLESLRKDRTKRLMKNPTQEELNIIDALQKQGVTVPEYKPAIGPQASANIMIKPIYILTDKIA